MEYLKQKSLKISNKDLCLNFLNRVNYYNVSVYFKCCNCAGLDFENIIQIYEFDRELRNLLFSVIGEIEIFMRKQISYRHSEKYGGLGYLDKNTFNDYHNHIEFLSRIENECIKRNENSLIVKHHKEKYNGNFPLWVIIDFFSAGSLSRFYSDMIYRDKRIMARELFGTNYACLESWFKCFTILRNKCAHYSRLYFLKFSDYPRFPQNSNYKLTMRLFDQLLVLKFLYPDKTRWEENFVKPLSQLIDKYKAYIKLEDIGFSDNWQQILSN